MPAVNPVTKLQRQMPNLEAGYVKQIMKSRMEA